MLAHKAWPRWRLEGLVKLSTAPPLRQTHYLAQQYRPKLLPAIATTPSHRKTHARIGPKKPIDVDSPRIKSLLKKQLYHINEPFQVAKHVESELRKGCFEMALVFTRKASARMDCVVAWNFLLQYFLGEQRLRASLKLFNEMKKRGQQPNAQTYTMLFSGFARSENVTIAVAEAVKLYHAMLSSDRLQPNSIHLNALVNVCAKAQDIEAMFSIIETRNDTNRSPSHVTYTTILHALRAKAETDLKYFKSKYMAEEQLHELKSQALHRCKGVWDEVIRKWRNGSIILDEELVCAMARALLLGDREDRLGVLDLVNQTMGIPNLDKDGKESSVPVVDTAVARKKTNTIQVVPRHNVLSVIIQALSLTRMVGVAMDYWNLLTTKYHIVPDSNNWHWLLTAIKRGHASGRAADAVEAMPRNLLHTTTFRMAMAACVRDTNSPNVYSHADRVMAVMMGSLDRLDPETTREYLSLAISRLAKATGNRAKTSTKDRMMHITAILNSLDTLWDPLAKSLQSLEHQGLDHTAIKELSSRAYQETAEVIAVVRRYVSLYDLLLPYRDLKSSARLAIEKRRNLLNRYVAAFYVPPPE